MNLIDLDIAISLIDPSKLVDGCKCDPSVNYICEGCFIHGVLCECKRELTLPAEDKPIDANEVELLQAALESMRAENAKLQAIIDSKLHMRQCHDCGMRFYAADAANPCANCKSQDTRLVKKGAMP